MDIQNPKIEFYKTRKVSEILGDTFAFLRQDWRVQLKYFCYLALPASIILGFFYSRFMTFYMNALGLSTQSEDISSLISFVVTALLSCVGLIVASIILYAITYALIKLYRQRDNGLEALDNEQFMPTFKSCLRRAGWFALNSVVLFFLIAIILGCVVAVFAVIMAGVSDGGTGLIFPILLFILLIYFAFLGLLLPLALLTPIYMMEEISYWKAVHQAYRYGMRLWGTLFVTMFVVGLLIHVAQMVFVMPFYISVFLKTFLLGEGESDGSLALTLFGYASSVLLCFGILLSSYVIMIATTIFYGHASDKIDGKGVAGKIEHFDEFDAF